MPIGLKEAGPSQNDDGNIIVLIRKRRAMAQPESVQVILRLQGTAFFETGSRLRHPNRVVRPVRARRTETPG